MQRLSVMILLGVMLVSCTNEPKLEPVTPPSLQPVEPSEETVLMSDEARIIAATLAAEDAFWSNGTSADGYFHVDYSWSWQNIFYLVRADESLGIPDDVYVRFKWGKVRCQHSGYGNLKGIDFELDVTFDDDARIYRIVLEALPIVSDDLTSAFSCKATINDRPYYLTIPYYKFY